ISDTPNRAKLPTYATFGRYYHSTMAASLTSTTILLPVSTCLSESIFLQLFQCSPPGIDVELDSDYRFHFPPKTMRLLECSDGKFKLMKDLVRDIPRY